MNRNSLTISAIFTIGCFFVAIQSGLAQKNDRWSRYSLQFSYGKSDFVADGWKSESRLAKHDPRINLHYALPVTEQLNVSLGLGLGWKIKGKRAYAPNSGYRLSSPYNTLEETVNSRHHFYFEIPAMINFELLPRLSVGAGINARHFLPNKGYEYSSGGDFFSWRWEWGYTATAGFEISPNVKLTANYFQAINDIYSASGEINGQSFSYRVKNRYYAVGVMFPLKVLLFQMARISPFKTRSSTRLLHHQGRSADCKCEATF